MQRRIGWQPIVDRNGILILLQLLVNRSQLSLRQLIIWFQLQRQLTVDQRQINAALAVDGLRETVEYARQAFGICMRRQRQFLPASKCVVGGFNKRMAAAGGGQMLGENVS